MGQSDEFSGTAQEYARARARAYSRAFRERARAKRPRAADPPALEQPALDLRLQLGRARLEGDGGGDLGGEEEAAKHFTDFAHTERTSVSVLLNGEGQRRLLLANNEHGAAGAEVGQQKQEQDGQPPVKRAKR
mgnify:CR=1 FL=1